MRGRKRLCVVACVLSMSVGEVSMGMGVWRWYLGLGKRYPPAAAAAPAGSGWTGPGLGWGLLDGEGGPPREQRCGPVQVGDHGAHTQAGVASRQDFSGTWKSWATGVSRE